MCWFSSAWIQNVTANGEIICEKARQFACELGVPQSEFDCSVGCLKWLKFVVNQTE